MDILLLCLCVVVFPPLVLLVLARPRSGSCPRPSHLACEPVGPIAPLMSLTSLEFVAPATAKSSRGGFGQSSTAA